MIDFVGQLRVDIAQRIVGERGKMADRFEAFQVATFDIANILNDAVGLRQRPFEKAVDEKIGIEADNFVASFLKNRNQQHSDVAMMTGYQDSHSISRTMRATLTVARGAEANA